MSDVTQILDAVSQGGPKAADQLLPLIYDELRRLAAQKMSKEQSAHTLQPTALVHEAYLRLISQEKKDWQGRNHFFSAAAEAMRRILVDNARRKAAQKRGDGQPLLELNESRIELRAPSEDVLAVHEALDELEQLDRVAAEVVKLRYFVGMTLPEIAAALGISKSTADRKWAFARAWLKTAIRPASEHSTQV